MRRIPFLLFILFFTQCSLNLPGPQEVELDLSLQTGDSSSALVSNLDFEIISTKPCTALRLCSNKECKASSPGRALITDNSYFAKLTAEIPRLGVAPYCIQLVAFPEKSPNVCQFEKAGAELARQKWMPSEGRLLKLTPRINDTENPEALYDGNFSFGVGTGLSSKEFIEADLGETKTIARIRITSLAGCGWGPAYTDHFENRHTRAIQFSFNDIDWMTYSLIVGASDTAYLDFAPGFAARYWRVVSFSDSGIMNWLGLGEFVLQTVASDGQSYITEPYRLKISSRYSDSCSGKPSYFPINHIADCSAQSSFISRWKTDNLSSGSSGANQIKLPLESSGTYDFTVDWGDGSLDTIKAWNDPNATHTYENPGIYNLSIKGTLNGFRFAESGDRLKLLRISQFGKLRLGNGGQYFAGAQNLTINTRDLLDLSETTSLHQAFRGCSSLLTIPSIEIWDTRKVVDMSGLFQDATQFNPNIENWNVSNVTNMTDILLNTALSQTNYDALLQAWSTQNVKPNVMFSAGTTKYSSSSQAARDILTGKGWNITDGGPARGGFDLPFQ